MAYFTVPIMAVVTIWVAVSLRTGRFTLYLRSGPSGFMGRLQDWDTMQYTRRNEPVQYWIAVGTIAALGLTCLVVTVIAARMGMAW